MAENAKLSKDSHDNFAKPNMRDSAPDLSSILLDGIGAGYSECAQTVSDYWSEIEQTAFIDDTPEDAVSVFDLIRLVGDPRRLSLEQIITQAQEEKRNFLAWQKSGRPLEVVRFFYRTKGNKQEIKIDHVGTQNGNFILTLQVACDENGCFEIWHATEKPEDNFPVYRFLSKNCLAEPFARTVVLRENLKFKINAFANHNKIVVKISCGFEIAWQNLLEKMPEDILVRLTEMMKDVPRQDIDGQFGIKHPLSNSRSFPAGSNCIYPAGTRNNLLEPEGKGNCANLFASFEPGKSNFPPVITAFFVFIFITLIMGSLQTLRNTGADARVKMTGEKFVSKKTANAEKTVPPASKPDMSETARAEKPHAAEHSSQEIRRAGQQLPETGTKIPPVQQVKAQNEFMVSIEQPGSEPILDAPEAMISLLAPLAVAPCKGVSDEKQILRREGTLISSKGSNEDCFTEQFSSNGYDDPKDGNLFTPPLPKTELSNNKTLER